MILKDPKEMLMVERSENKKIHVPEGIEIEEVYQVLLKFKNKISQAYGREKSIIKKDEIYSEIILEIIEQKLTKTPLGMIHNLIDRIKAESLEEEEKRVANG